MREKTYLYNEYYKITQMRLRQYPYQKVAVENLKERIQDMEARLEMETGKITPIYGKEPVQSSGDMSQTELVVESRLTIQHELSVAKRSYDRLSHILKLTDRALDALKEDELAVVKKCYFSGLDLSTVARELGMSLGTCKRRSGEGTRHVAYMLFGDVSEEDVYSIN